jgi:hypothetical protein
LNESELDGPKPVASGLLFQHFPGAAAFAIIATIAAFGNLKV